MILTEQDIKILQIKFSEANFLKDIVLQDDGQGSYIKKWSLSAPAPTRKDLDTWKQELDLQYRQQQAVSKRIYPSINEQLDMQYHDLMNGTTVWKDTITQIKQKWPKPRE